MRLVLIPLLIVVMVANTAFAGEPPQVIPCAPSQAARSGQRHDAGQRVASGVRVTLPTPTPPSLRPLPPCATIVIPQVRARQPQLSPKAEAIMTAVMAGFVVAAYAHASK